MARLFMIIVSGFLLVTSAAGQSSYYAITNVNVITMRSDDLLTEQTVLVDNGVIRSISPSSKTRVPKLYRIIDGKGKYLIPGLFDMHTHFLLEQGDNVDYGEAELKLMLANGLTTARITNGDQNYLLARENVNAGKWRGPDLIVTSPQLVGSWPFMGKMFAGVCKTPQQADSLVRLYKKQGYDEIKLTVGIKPDVYAAINKTAKEVGITVMGHVGPYVGLPRALAAKQQVEHMDQFIDMLLPDTSYNHGQSVSDMNLWSRNAWATVRHLDMTKIGAVVRDVRNAGIYVTPTNYFFYSFFGMGIDEEAEKQKASFQYIPTNLREYAFEVNQKYRERRASEEDRMRYVAIRKQFIQELWTAGVPLMAGSDSPQWFGVTGFALHEELENLVLSGLTPYAALETATINPARYLRLDKRKGTIETGKSAEFLLLDGNPLTDISNTRRISAVFIRNQWFDRTSLDQMLAQAKSVLNP